MGKVYRTANGKLLDFESLLLNNELTPAVGNTRVNARGDQIDSKGNIIKTRAEIMKEYHKLNTMIPKDEKVHQKSTLKPDTLGDKNDG